MKFLADETKVRVLGRTLMIDKVRYLNYSASAIEFEFTGKKATADIITFGDMGEDRFKGWMAVFVNDDPVPYKRFCLDEEEKTYILYEEEKCEKVKIKLVKLSEASFGKAGIKSITIDGDIEPVKPKAKERRLEFIGDSITCGYGIEGKLGEGEFDTAEENPMINYAGKTAEYFNADFNLISWSSMGVITSWVNEDEDEVHDDWLMPMLYKYTDIGISKDFEIKEPEKWDNSKFKPDVIVINLGTNDTSYTRGIKERVEAFGEGYYKFLQDIREKNSMSSIVCTLGAMGQELCPEIERQVKKFREDNDDNNVFYMPFDVQKEEDGIGTDTHPNDVTHGKMGNKLIEFIKEIKGWN